MKFLIESKYDLNTNYTIPAQNFGYATINAIDYYYWYTQERNHTYFLQDLKDIGGIAQNILSDIIPVGSVEFCLEIYKQMGIRQILPLNIPKPLWGFVKRDIGISDLSGLTGNYFIKDVLKIKDEINDFYHFPTTELLPGKHYFYSKQVDIVSEWRCFVYNGELLGVRCYSGDEWILPDKKYIKSIISNYNKKVYTLDVMICENGETDILELHDFFACGLYGFEHHKLLDMMIARKREILSSIS